MVSGGGLKRGLQCIIIILIIWKKSCHVRLDYFTLFHQGSSSHVKLLSSYLYLPISYPSSVVPAFEELPFYVG